VNGWAFCDKSVRGENVERKKTWRGKTKFGKERGSKFKSAMTFGNNVKDDFCSFDGKSARNRVASPTEFTDSGSQENYEGKKKRGHTKTNREGTQATSQSRPKGR